MRIIGGKWAGVTLASPGSRVRPTAEALRGTWMEWLQDDLPGARVLDLFAGTGALGLEALSRGARTVDFVENGPEALHALKANRAKLRVSRETRLFKKEAFRFLDGAEELAYDLALADPPYNSLAGEKLVHLWQLRPFSRILSVEHSRERTLPGGGVRRVLDDFAVTTYRIRTTSRRG
ncbi:MAG: RsmD family RNA methyltransferase [Longimicrobiales bacterium]